MIPDFRREVGVNCALLGYYAASSSDSLQTFRHNLSVPSSRVKNPLLSAQSPRKRAVINLENMLRGMLGVKKGAPGHLGPNAAVI